MTYSKNELGKPRLRWVAGVEKNRQEIKVTRWRQNAVKREDWAR
jgi:hypothetical protein